MMQRNSIAPLKILNASAGSGKTYNLVKEYLLLLLKEENDANRFARIIAMTFTNKAALEMKTRIIKALDELSYPALYNSKKVERFAEELAAELGIIVLEVNKRAERVLQGVLHRYEDFHVMTIDKFNLKLIRSFSRDLDLPADFDVILNEAEVIEQVVDLLLSELGKEGLTSLTALVVEYATHKLDEGEKWDFRNQLVAFGMVLTKEKDQALLEKLMEMDFSVARHKELRSELRSEREAFLKECKRIYTLYEGLNINERDLPGASRTANALAKLASYKEIVPKDFMTDAFLKLLADEPPKGKVFPLELRESLLVLNQRYMALRPRYFARTYFLKNFFNMALLQQMAKRLNVVKKDEQLIRISEFNRLIAELVRNEDAPFIYERLGTRFKNFLLDEFQDTSRLQWLNMVPLLHESLANEEKNLIVGDPKQSIYRFKNGVAEQFVALPSIYNPEKDAAMLRKSAYFEQMGKVESLEDNWRSATTIVGFNNAFFPLIREELPSASQAFYGSIFQHAKSDQEGLVEIVSSSEERTLEELMDEVCLRIEECERDGFKRGDICLLSDKNREANGWAIELTHRGYKVVSAESLLVHNEVKVKLAVSYVRRRLNPSNDSERKRFAELFFRLKETEGFTLYRSYFHEKKLEDGKAYTFFNDGQFIADFFGSAAHFFGKYETIYDLIQTFYRMMGWDELTNPYLHHFADFAHLFELAKGPDLKSFLAYYEEQKSKLAIQLPESDDAIKIMTMHKSKGLEFPVVILPSIDFSVELMSTAQFLVEVDEVILYTTLSQSSPVKELAEYKSLEQSQILTDKVNLCYVAFTRPQERLYVFNYYSNRKFGALAHGCFALFPEAVVTDERTLSLSLGRALPQHRTEEGLSSVFFEPTNCSDRLWFPDISLQDDNGLLENDLLSDERRFGNQFHLAMASINDPSEVKTTLKRLVDQGELEVAFRSGIEEKINAVFALPEFQALFNGATTILNEQAIILDEQTTLRPDKLILKPVETLVIDYKTGMKKKKDSDQVMGYVKALEAMGMPNVKGWVVYGGELVGVG